MSKIIGVTVGTAMAPSTIKEKLHPVTSVNGQSPDENGNVVVEGGGSASAVPDEEMLGFLAELDIVQPLSNPNGVIYTDTNNKLYVL